MNSDNSGGGTTPKRPDAKVVFVTTKATNALINILRPHLPKHVNVHALIQSGGVWLNQQRLCSENIQVKAKQTLKCYLCPTQGYTYHFSKESIIKETDDWVVVMKEPLVTIGMDRSNMHFNLMAGLNHYYGHKNMQTGVQPITRLDYRVSGLCLFSKHKSAERRLFMQMQQRRIKKRYLAVVASNHPPSMRCTNNDPLHYHHKAIVSESGKPAKTRFILKSANHDDVHIYQAITKTGRRHQVRAHAATSIGALVNDELYGNRSRNRHQTIGLIANHLRFYWNGEWVNIQLNSKWETQALAWLRMGAG